MPGSTTPKVWTPERKPISLANVSAGEWVQVQFSYRDTNTSPVLFGADHFLIHILYEPNTDDSVGHLDQPTAYGGSPAKGIRTRSVYRSDPGITFQVPWNGQISAVAGDDSDPATCVLDVIVRRGFPPRMPARRDVDVLDLPDIWALACSSPLEAYAMFNDALARLCDVGGVVRPVGERIWWPPVVRPPKLIPATWIQVPPSSDIAPSVIPFPDGAEFIEIVDASGVPGNPIRLVVSTLGNAGLFVDVASGIRRTIAHFTQGGAGPDGVPARWSPVAGVNSATVWSTLGN